MKPPLSDPLREITTRLDNRKFLDNREPKVTGLNGVGRVGLRLDN